ncbi:MAG: IS3 family transposase, partial [Spirochaetota bacterium]
QFSQEQKREAVISLCSRRGSAEDVANTHGATRASLYKWKNDLLGKENTMARAEKKNKDLPNDKDQLLSEIEMLKDQVRRLKIEKDILEAAAELIKKDPGVDLKDLSNREKTALIGALKNEHPLKSLLNGLGLSRSSYYYQLCAQSLESKYKALQNHIIELFDLNNRCYGYRRIHGLLAQEGIKVSEKVVRMLMEEASLVAQPKRRRKYSSYCRVARSFLRDEVFLPTS